MSCIPNKRSAESFCYAYCECVHLGHDDSCMHGDIPDTETMRNKCINLM